MKAAPQQVGPSGAVNTRTSLEWDGSPPTDTHAPSANLRHVLAPKSGAQTHGSSVPVLSLPKGGRGKAKQSPKPKHTELNQLTNPIDTHRC